ncbi:hypothetical protein Avbf_05456 [Armadillidium vulgare]|nr:hypothetical protein Avbf_05456 [Armadillidium vulgare]
MKFVFAIQNIYILVLYLEIEKFAHVRFVRNDLLITTVSLNPILSEEMNLLINYSQIRHLAGYYEP